MRFDEYFFEKEIRQGFEISSMMKRAWAAELEMLSIVDGVCKDHNITWFADFGTLLGAVRHQGFIPWDDDVDICLKREDYNRLLKVLPKSLPYGFSVAGMHAEEKRLQDAARVHQLRVIADETMWDFRDYMKYFHGFPYQRIGIDIFPIDYLPWDAELEELQKEILRYGFLTVQHWEMWEERGELEERISNISQICHIDIPKDEKRYNYIWRLLDHLSGLYEEQEADMMAEWMFYLEEEGYRMHKEWYSEVVYLPFENGIKMPVPCGYKEILTGIYGDYMTPSRQGAEHDYPFYGHMETELKKQIRAFGFDGTIDEFCAEMADI